MSWIQYAQSVGDGMQNFWYNDETGETSFDDLPPQRVQQIWNSTPGGLDQKLAAIAREGPGNAGAIDLAAKAGLASPQALQSSGTGIAVQQASADSGGLGDFLKKAIPSALVGTSAGLTGQALATGNDPKQAALLDVGALAAAPEVAAALPATGLSTLTAAAPAAAPSAAVGATAATTAAPTTAAAAPALADAGMDLGMYGEFGNPYVLGTAAPGATAATNAAAATGAGVGGATAAGIGAAGAGTGTALSRMLDNNPANPAGTADYLSAAGILGATGLGIYGANQQANALSDVAGKEDARIREMMAFGAPYRGRLESLYADPTSYLTSPEVTVPVQQGTDALARALSVRGNPAGSGTALQEIQNYSANQLYGRLGSEKDRLAGLGGLTQYAGGAAKGPDLSPSVGAINAQGGAIDALGFGISQLSNPRRSLGDYLRSLT